MNAIEERRSIGGIEHGQSPAQLGGGLVKAEWGNQHLGEAVADPRSPFGDRLVDRRPTSSGLNRFAIDSPLEERRFELVWGFSCQVDVFGLHRVLCSEREGRSSFFNPT